MASIGKRILNLRKNKDLSQKELAEQVGITEASLSRYENDLREPKAEIIAKIAEALECSTDYLLGLTNNKTEYKSKSNLHKNETKYESYGDIEKIFIKRLIDEGVIKENEPIPKNGFDKLLEYGIDAAVEILKLEKKLG